MPVKVIYRNRRITTDRRKGTQAYHGTERRRGVDRRKLDEKLRHMIESNRKDPETDTRMPIQQRTGLVVRRRKSNADNGST